ncbi:MAG: DUF86 domain-containing protein [Anaerolineae bacterium]
MWRSGAFRRIKPAHLSWRTGARESLDSHKFWPRSKDYRDAFQVLNEVGIIPDDFTRTMRAMAGMRNLLVHLYWEVDDRMVYETICTELDDFETFVSYVLAFMERIGPP